MVPVKRKRSRRVAEGPAAPYTARRFLLDTHVWIWWQSRDRRLGPRARAAIATATEVRLSAVSVWEISIKSGVGKLTLPKDASIEDALARHGIQPLPVEIRHAVAVRALPNLHRDPFDRMLVAQALSEGLTLVTADLRLAGYGVETLRATE